MVYPYNGHPSWTNHRCEKLAQSFYAVVPGRDPNPRLLDRESDALPRHHPDIALAISDHGTETMIILDNCVLAPVGGVRSAQEYLCHYIRVHIVAQQANRYIMAFHITILRYRMIFTYQAAWVKRQWVGTLVYTEVWSADASTCRCRSAVLLE